MSFRLYHVRRDLNLTRTYENGDVRFLVSDPILGTYFKVSFLQFSILRYFQERPSTASACAQYLEERYQVEVDERTIASFIESMRQKQLLTLDRAPALSAAEIGSLHLACKDEVRHFVLKHTARGELKPQDTDVLSSFLAHVRLGRFLDGLHTLEAFLGAHPQSPCHKIYQKFYQRFLNLLKSKRPSSGVELVKVSESVSFLDPTPLFQKYHQLIFAAMSRTGILAYFSLLGFGVFTLIQKQVPQFNMEWILNTGVWAMNHLPLMMLMGMLNTTIHEFGHAVMCYRFGATVKRMGYLMFLGFMPAFFADTTDSYRLPKWRRVLVSLGGVWGQSLLACLLIPWLHVVDLTSDLGMLITLNTLTWIMSAVLNLVPLLKLDGYYILSDLTGVQNLFERSFAYTKARALQLFTAQSVELEAVDRKTALTFVFYASATTLFIAYQFSAMFLISIAMADRATFFMRFIQYIFLLRMGGTLAEKIVKDYVPRLKTRYHSFWTPLDVTVAPAMTTTPWRYRLREAVSRHRRPLLISGALLFPFPLSLTFDARVIPEQTVTLRSPGQGFVHTWDITEGKQVRKGTPLLALAHPRKQVEKQKLELEVAALESQLDLLNQGPRRDELAVIEATYLSAQTNAQHLRDRVMRLAPVSSQRDQAAYQDQYQRAIGQALWVKAQGMAEVHPQYRSQREELRRRHTVAVAHLNALNEELQRMQLESPISGQLLDVSHSSPPYGKAVGEGELLGYVADAKRALEVDVAQVWQAFLAPKMTARFVDARGHAHRGHITHLSVSPYKDAHETRSRFSMFAPSSHYVGRMSLENPEDTSLALGMRGQVRVSSGVTCLLDLLTRPLRRSFTTALWLL